MFIEKLRKFVSRNEDLHPEFMILKDAILELSDSIQALKERVEELEDNKLNYRLLQLESCNMTQADAIIEMLSKHIPNYPPTIPAPSPVLNDGKAGPDLSQRPPFVTGLSVLDSLKK